MAKDIKRRFTVNLDIDTKDAEKQIKATVGNLKTVLADLGNASDKMSYFKELADYLQQVDSELSRLKTKHGEEFFNQFFGGLDTNLRTEMEKVFGTAKAQMTQLEQIRNRLSNVRALGDTDEAKTEIKALEQDIKDLFATIGKADEIQLSGRGKLETRLANMESALDKFALVWDGVNAKIQQGFSFGGTGTGDGNGIPKLSDAMQKEVDQLEKQVDRYKTIIDRLNTIKSMNDANLEGDQIKLNIDATEESAKQLIARYNQLQEEAEGLDKTSAMYAANLAESAEIALQLTAINEKLIKTNKNGEIIKHPPDFLVQFLKDNTEQFEYILEDFDFEFKNIVQTLNEGLIDAETRIQAIKADASKYASGVGTGSGSSGADNTSQIEKAKAALREFLDLADKVSNKSFDTFGNAEDNVEIGKYIERLTVAKKELDALGEQGLLTAEELQSINDAFASANTHLEDHTMHYNGYGDGEYNYSYYSEYQEQKDRANALEEKNRQLESELAEARSGGLGYGDGTGSGTGGGTGQGDGTVTAEVDFTSLENTITTEAGKVVQKLNDVLKVEVVKGEKAEYVENMTSQLHSMFNAMSQKSNVEYKALISDNEINAWVGNAGEILGKTTAEAYLANLHRATDVDLHSHQGISPTVDVPDLRNTISRYYNGSTKMSAIVGEEDILTLDLTKVKAEDAYKALKKVEEIVSKSTNKTLSAKQLNNIFTDINSEYTNVAQIWNPDQFEDLAARIFEIRQNSEQALTPLERFKNLLMSLTHGKIDLSKYEKLFNEFSIDKAGSIFNDIMKSEGMEEIQVGNIQSSSLDVITRDLQKQKKEFIELRKTAKFTYKDIRKEVERYKKDGSNRESFLEKFFHPQEVHELYAAFADVEDELLTIDALVDRVAGDFGIITKTKNAAGQSQKSDIAIDSTNLEQSMTNLGGQIENNTTSVGKLTGAVEDLTTAMNKETTKDSKQEAIDFMKQNLQQVFKQVSEHNSRMVNGKHVDQETSAEFFADGSVSLGYGESGTVSFNTIMEGVLSNILSQSVMSMHSHPWADFFGSMFGNISAKDLVFSNDTFSGANGDIGAWYVMQQYGSQLGSMLTGNILRTLDIGKISKKYPRFLSNLLDIEEEYANDPKYAQYIGRDSVTGKMRLKHQSSIEGWHTEMDIFRQMMFDALKRTGFSDKDIGSLYQEYNLTDDADLTRLATTLVELSASAKSADTQVEALKNLLIAVGSSKMKDDVTATAKKIKGIGSGFISDDGNTDLDYFLAKSQIRAYAGNVYDSELTDIDALFNAGDFRQAGIKLMDIAKQMGTDIEGQEGLTALEAFRKGEATIADVWNNFSNLGKVSQEAIDKMRVVDASQQSSAEEQLLSQMANSLTSIDTKVTSIEANTQRTVSEQLDADAQMLADIYNGGDKSKLLGSTDSKFASENISEYKAMELYNAANDAIAKFSDELINIVTASQNGEEVNSADAQKLIALYKQAVTSTNDALMQIRAYEGRYDANLTDPNFGQLIETDIELMLNRLTKESSVEIGALVDIIKRAKANLADSLAYIQQPVQDNDDWEDDWKDADDFEDIADNADNSNLTSCLSSLTDAIERLIGKLSGDTDFTITQAAPTMDESMHPVDVTSEISQCRDLLDVVDYITQAINEKTAAFEHEKSTVAQIIPTEVEILKELGQYLETLRESIENLFVNFNTNQNIFEPWKNDLIIIKDNIDNILSNFREIEGISVNTNNPVGENATPPVDKGYALESTLQGTNGILNSILTAVKGDTKLTTALTNATAELKKIASGTSGDGTSGDDGTPPSPSQTPFSKLKYNQTSIFNEYREELKDADYMTKDFQNRLDQLALDLSSADDKASLEKWKNEFKELRSEIASAQAAFNEIQKNKLTQIRGALNSEFKTLNFSDTTPDLTPEQREILDLREQIIQQLNVQEASIKNGKEVEIDSLTETMSLLREKTKLYREQNDIINTGGKSGQKVGATTAQNAKVKYKALYNQATSDEFNDSLVVQQALQKYTAAYEALIAKRKELASLDSVTDEQEAEFKALTQTFNDCGKALNKIIENSKKLRASDVSGVPYKLGADFTDDDSGRKAALTEFINQLDDVNQATIKFDDSFTKCMYTVDNGDGTFTKMTATFDQARTRIVQLAGESAKATTGIAKLWDMFKGKLASIGTYLAASLGFQEVWQQIRKGIEYVREIDLALTELKKVTDETEESYDRFLQTASKTASEIGSTVADFVNATADFARLGYDIQQAANLAEAASVYKNVGDGIDDIATASESIISTMKAFGIEANDAMGIVDRFNEVGNHFAISSTGIGDAMQRSASALYEAGNTIDESIALITGANSVIQNPEQVGTALKTLALRLRGAKVELEEAGEDVDGMAESTSQLQSKLKALTHGKVDIMLDANTFKNTTQILREMSQAWEDMTDIERASALELMGGKRQANILSSIIKNFDTVEDVIVTSMDSAGSAVAENEKYLDSIQGKTELFTNSLQTMWMNALDSDMIKFIVDFGTSIIKVIDKLGVFNTALTGVFSYLSMSKKHNLDFASILGIHTVEDGWFSNLKNQIQESADASKNLFSILEQTKNIKFEMGTDVDMAQQVDLLNSKLAEGQESFVNYVSGLGDADIALKAYAASVKDGSYSLAGFQDFITQHNAKVKASGIAAKAAAVGHQLLNAAISMGVSLLISGAISAFTKLVNVEKDAAESAREAADASKELRDEFKSLDDYKEQIKELRTELDSNTMSESEAYDAREKLLSIQKDLIDKFGLEKDGINLVTGAIEEQIAAIDELSQKEAQQWLNTNQKEINNAIEFFDSDTKGGVLDKWSTETVVTNWGSTQNIQDMINGYANDPKHSHISTSNLGRAQDIKFKGSVEEVKKEVEDFSNWLGSKESELQTELTNLTSLSPDEREADWSTQVESLKRDIAQLQDVREDLGVEYKNWFGADSTYASYKATLEETQYNTALTQYAKEYGNILQAQKDLAEAQAKGDQEGIKQALGTINAETSAAAKTAETNGQSYMVNFFNGMQGEYSKLSKELNLAEGLSGNLKTAMGDILSGLDGMNAQEILQLKDIELTGDFEKYKFEWDALNQIANEYDMTIEDLIDALVRLGYIQSDFTKDVEKVESAVASYNALLESINQYHDIVSETSDITIDNTEVTEEYKESLKTLGISEEDLAECFYDTNPLIVKNAKLLNNLVKSTNKNIARNAQLAKSQAKLQYYELYKKMSRLVNANGVVADSSKDLILSYYEEMKVLEDTIAKYAKFEAQLLGNVTAYEEFQKAQESDAETDPMTGIEEMAVALGEAFNTAELGTETARAAISGLVPESVYENLDTVDEKIAAIYDYFKNGKLSQYLDITFDEEGNIEQAEMKLGNLRKFIEDGLANGTFAGADWQHFEFSDTFLKGLDQADDKLQYFADQFGVTKDVAFAVIESINDHDAEWLNGDYGNLFEAIVPDGIEDKIYKNTSALAELNAQVASGKISAEEYAQKYQELTATSDELGQQARDNISQYQDLTNQINDQKTKIDEYTAAVQKMKDQGKSEEEIKASVEYQSLIEASGLYTELIQKRSLLSAPTELLIQFAIDNIDQEIAQIESDLKDKIDFGEDGKFTVKFEAEFTEEDLEKINKYKQLWEEKHELELETDPEDTKTALEEIESSAQSALDVINSIDGTTITINTSTAVTNVTKLTDALKELAGVSYVDIQTSNTTPQRAYTETRSDSWLKKHYAMADGTAHASGDWGLPTNEHNALVGELGTELV